MSETPRDQRALWREVSRSFEELGEALRVHLSPDAARTPSDPTDPAGAAPTATDRAATDRTITGDEAGAESAPWADPATGSPRRAGEGAGIGDSDWIAPADDGEAADAGTESAPWADPARPGQAEGLEDPWSAATAGDTPPRAGAGHAGTGSAEGAEGAEGAGGPGDGTRDREWREWSGSPGGRFATQADWESARESVRDLGRSAQRIATQAGDAARDPHVRDSAQRAARSLGDAIVTTVEDFASDLRSRVRTPRWSDTSRPSEPPPVAPIEDDHDEKL